MATTTGLDDDQGWVEMCISSRPTGGHSRDDRRRFDIRRQRTTPGRHDQELCAFQSRSNTFSFILLGRVGDEMIPPDMRACSIARWRGM